MPYKDPEKRREWKRQWQKNKLATDLEYKKKRNSAQRKRYKKKCQNDPEYKATHLRLKRLIQNNKIATDPEYRKKKNDGTVKWRLANLDVIKKLMAEFRKDGCRTCPEKSHDCLQAHHKNPKEKKYSIGRITSGNYSRNSIIVELAKCSCLCANCHMKLHARQRRREKKKEIKNDKKL